jgi:hypothetical protein
MKLIAFNVTITTGKAKGTTKTVLASDKQAAAAIVGNFFPATAQPMFTLTQVGATNVIVG